MHKAADSKLPDMLIEKTVLRLPHQPLVIISGNDFQNQLLCPPAFCRSQQITASLVSTGQHIHKLTRIEVIGKKFIRQILRQQAAQVLHHLVRIDFPTKHLISRIQHVTTLRHLEHMFVGDGVGSEAHCQCTSSILYHTAEFRMRTYRPARLFKPFAQKTINARTFFRNTGQKVAELRSGKLRSTRPYGKAVSLAPRVFCPVLIHGTEPPVPLALIQHTVRIEHAPGNRFRQNIIVSPETSVLRKIELKQIAFPHGRRHQ